MAYGTEQRSVGAPSNDVVSPTRDGGTIPPYKSNKSNAINVEKYAEEWNKLMASGSMFSCFVIPPVHRALSLTPAQLEEFHTNWNALLDPKAKKFEMTFFAGLAQATSDSYNLCFNYGVRSAPVFVENGVYYILSFLESDKAKIESLRHGARISPQKPAPLAVVGTPSRKYMYGVNPRCGRIPNLDSIVRDALKRSYQFAAMYNVAPKDRAGRRFATTGYVFSSCDSSLEGRPLKLSIMDKAVKVKIFIPTKEKKEARCC